MAITIYERIGEGVASASNVGHPGVFTRQWPNGISLDNVSGAITFSRSQVINPEFMRRFGQHPQPIVVDCERQQIHDVNPAWSVWYAGLAESLDITGLRWWPWIDGSWNASTVTDNAIGALGVHPYLARDLVVSCYLGLHSGLDQVTSWIAHRTTGSTLIAKATGHRVIAAFQLRRTGGGGKALLTDQDFQDIGKSLASLGMDGLFWDGGDDVDQSRAAAAIIREASK